eukprot:g4347.t1
MKIKESIKSLGPVKGAGSNGALRALQRCLNGGKTHGMKTWPVAYYRSLTNTKVEGTNYIDLDALGVNGGQILYKFNCKFGNFAGTGLCKDISRHNICTRCFGDDRYKTITQSMYGGILTDEADKKKDGNMKITLTVKCWKTRAGQAKYRYSVSEGGGRRRRLLAERRGNGDCRL